MCTAHIHNIISYSVTLCVLTPIDQSVVFLFLFFFSSSELTASGSKGQATNSNVMSALDASRTSSNCLLTRGRVCHPRRTCAHGESCSGSVEKQDLQLHLHTHLRGPHMCVYIGSHFYGNALFT